jgi:microcystin-dependent protein
MSSIFSNGLNTNGISSVSPENNLLLGGANTNTIQLLSPIIGNGTNDITINNDTTIKGNTTIDGNLSMNGIVTNVTSVTLTNQLTTKSYVDSFVPVGTIIMYASLENPPTGGTGYYLCDGSVKNTTIDAALFAVVKYTYGGSDTNFNLPNLLGRFPVGPTTSSSMQYLNSFTGGNTAGNVTLNTLNLPPHKHTANSITNTTVTSTRTYANTSVPATTTVRRGADEGMVNATFSNTNFTITSNANTIIIANDGTSTPFPITPPYTVVAYYIKR